MSTPLQIASNRGALDGTIIGRGGLLSTTNSFRDMVASMRVEQPDSMNKILHNMQQLSIADCNKPKPAVVSILREINSPILAALRSSPKQLEPQSYLEQYANYKEAQSLPSFFCGHIHCTSFCISHQICDECGKAVCEACIGLSQGCLDSHVAKFDKNHQLGDNNDSNGGGVTNNDEGGGGVIIGYTYQKLADPYEHIGYQSKKKYFRGRYRLGQSKHSTTTYGTAAEALLELNVFRYACGITLAKGCDMDLIGWIKQFHHEYNIVKNTEIGKKGNRVENLAWSFNKIAAKLEEHRDAYVLEDGQKTTLNDCIEQLRRLALAYANISNMNDDEVKNITLVNDDDEFPWVGNYEGELLHMPDFGDAWGDIAPIDSDDYPKNIRSITCYRRFFPRIIGTNGTAQTYGTAQCYDRFGQVKTSNDKDLIIHAMLVHEREHAAECFLRTLIECPHRLSLVLKYADDFIMNHELSLEDKRDELLTALNDGNILRKDVQHLVHSYAVGEDRYPGDYTSPVCDTSESTSLDADAESVQRVIAYYTDQFKDEYARIKLSMEEASDKTMVKLSFMISFLIDMFSY